MQEQELNEALAENLEQAFEPLVIAYQERIFRFALRYCGNREDAEETAQDAFVRAYRALQTYSPERRRDLNLRPWLYTITLNIARNRVRRQRPVSVSIDLPFAGANRPMEIKETAPHAHPGDFAERRETWHELTSAIAALPTRYRAAVILRHIEGLSYAEVAAALDQPVGTAKANVHRGIRLLRDSLESPDLVAATRVEGT